VSTFVSNSEPFTFMQKTWFVIMNLWRMYCKLWLVYLWTHLHVSFDVQLSILWCKWFAGFDPAVTTSYFYIIA
jgi:hypothetical protein